MSDLLADITWLYRGVPLESPEVKDVQAIGEVRPPRPDHIGDYYRDLHHILGDTANTGYTSWSTDRSIAETAAEEKSQDYNTSGHIVVFRVRVDSLRRDCVFPGREDEDELLIEGIVEEVTISEIATDEEEDYE